MEVSDCIHVRDTANVLHVCRHGYILRVVKRHLISLIYLISPISLNESTMVHLDMSGTCYAPGVIEDPGASREAEYKVSVQLSC
jgi:hypothetical protein